MQGFRHDSEELQAGSTLGPYDLLAPIGVGGMARVWAARVRGTKDVVALKMLRPELAENVEFRKMFFDEARIASRVRHPNVCGTFEMGEQSGVLYLAMEWLDGPSLMRVLRPGDDETTDCDRIPVRPRIAARIVADACAGLHAAHELVGDDGRPLGVVHRDVSPHNILITSDGVVKVTDFGVAKVFALSPLTLAPDAYGTAGFLAPEYFTGRPLTRKSDLYALGGLLYLLLTGRPPYTAATTAEFLHKHCYVLPDRPMQFVPKLLPEFDELVCTLLSKDPGRRPASAVAVLEELDQIRGKAERKGEKVTWPPDPGTETMPALGDVYPAASGDEWERPAPLLSRPSVVLPLFVAFAAIVMLIWFWPRPSAAELISAARPLVTSNDPDDWDAAEDKYLAPLASRHPDQFADEVRAARTRIRDMRKLKKAVADGKKFTFESEPERRYARGVAFAQVGDFGAAKVEWVAVLDGGANDARWIALAATALAELEKK